jgi:hypothetical protein
MIDGFSDAQIIAALIALLVASYAAFFGWLVTSISGLRRDMHALNRETRQDLGGRIDAIAGRLDAKIDGTDNKLSAQINTAQTWLAARIEAVDDNVGDRINTLDARLSARIDAVDTKLSAKIDALTIAVSRLEGAVYHGLPEPRRAVSEQ